MTEAIKLAIEALEAAIPACELQGDKPGQLRWHLISDQLTAALAALRAQPDHSELVKELRGALASNAKPLRDDIWSINPQGWAEAMYPALVARCADALEGK